MNPLPSNLDAAKKNMVLDYELMGRLIKRDEESFAAMILMIMLAQYLGSQPKHGQTMIAQAMICIDRLYKALQENPHIESPENGVLGGCLMPDASRGRLS